MFRNGRQSNGKQRMGMLKGSFSGHRIRPIIMETNLYTVKIEEHWVDPAIDGFFTPLESLFYLPIPKDIIDKMGWQEGEEINFTIEGNSIILQRQDKKE